MKPFNEQTLRAYSDSIGEVIPVSLIYYSCGDVIPAAYAGALDMLLHLDVGAGANFTDYCWQADCRQTKEKDERAKQGVYEYKRSVEYIHTCFVNFYRLFPGVKAGLLEKVKEMGHPYPLVKYGETVKNGSLSPCTVMYSLADMLIKPFIFTAAPITQDALEYAMVYGMNKIISDMKNDSVIATF